MLHIVDGSSAELLLKDSSIQGDYLEWKDVLHEGPFYEGLSVKEVAVSRGGFLEHHFSVKPGKALEYLQKRNLRLFEAVSKDEEIVIWGSEELFDQLIVLECLWILHHMKVNLQKVSIIHVKGCMCSDGSKVRIQNYFEGRTAISKEHIEAGIEYWNYYVRGSFTDLITINLSLFPFMEQAFLRICQELPDPVRGLSRTESQILESLNREELTPQELFRSCRQMESPPFMGDLSFFIVLKQLSSSPNPLLLNCDGELFNLNSRDKLKLTDTGRDVLNGNLNLLDIIAVDRWVGGKNIRSRN